jgi:PAS domain-containing protein
MMADLVIMILMDVTERYEAIEALRVSEERYKLVLEVQTTNLGRDLQTDLVYYSPRWKRMIAWTKRIKHSPLTNGSIGYTKTIFLACEPPSKPIYMAR